MYECAKKLDALERALARKEALLQRWVDRKKAEGGLLQDGLLEDTERELEWK
jgi:hypothetical protein